MLIECTRCHAVFSVQDGVAQPGATFPVQCGRCLAVFDAVAPERAPVAAAAAPATSPPGVPAGAVEVPLPPVPDAVTALPDAVAAAAPMVRRMARGRWPLLVGGLVLAAIAGVAVTRRERMREIEEKIAQGQENVVVMLNRVIELPGLDDWSIWWGANLGTPHEELVAGRVATVLPDIHAARERVAERAGWILDIFLLRREA